MIGVGDLHLTDSNGKGGLATYITAEAHDAMVADLVINQVLKYARKHGERHIILYGDLCENPRMSYSGQLALARIFDHKDFEFHLIPGNHDMFSSDPAAGHSLQVIKLWGRKNVHVYAEPTDTTIDDLEVRFMPWPHQKWSKSRLNVGHVDVKGSKTDSGRLNSKDTMSESNATIVMGHIHTNQVVRNTYYSGTLYQTNFGEAPEKFFHHITYDDGWNVESVPVKPTYRLHTVEAESKADLKGVPVSEYDLVKLIVKSNKLRPVDYKHLNTVIVKPVKNEHELAMARVADLGEGSQVEINTTEFFSSWLEQQTVPEPLKVKSATLRTRLLKGNAK